MFVFAFRVLLVCYHFCDEIKIFNDDVETNFSHLLDVLSNLTRGLCGNDCSNLNPGHPMRRRVSQHASAPYIHVSACADLSTGLESHIQQSREVPVSS